MKQLQICVCLLLLVASSHFSDPWSPELAIQVKTIGDRYHAISLKSSGEIVPSPDGRMVAYTQTRAVMEEERSEMVTQIFLFRTDGAKTVQLTRGEKSCRSPSFSPDGRFVYFLSDRSGKQNIWRIAVDGGEAESVTDWDGDLTNYLVSRDGKWIAFAGLKTSQELEIARREKRDFRVVDENPQAKTLWVIPAEAKAGSVRSPRRIVEAPIHIVDFDWSPDSQFIAFEHWKRPEDDFWFTANLSEVEVATGKTRNLANTNRIETAPRYSPDGRYLAFLRSSSPPRWARDFRIALIARKGNDVEDLPPTFDSFGRGGQLLGWAADSKRIYFSETRGTRTGLYAMRVEGVSEPVHAPSNSTLSLYGSAVSLNLRGTHVGFSQESSEDPPEGFLLDLGKLQLTQVTWANIDLPQLPLGTTRRIEWMSKDGSRIEGLLTLPPNGDFKRKYPLVLIIHGGPMGVFTEMFIGRHGFYPEAMFSTRGYAVLRCNIRGSSGYGREFRFANQANWGGDDYEDLMSGVDHLISVGTVDPGRMAVMGWSYGGYMTAWIIGHTNRFKAAVVGAGVTNLWSFAGTTDIPGFLPDYFLSEPWDNISMYLKHSPLSFVRNVKTPTLVLHGDADERVPVSQGRELYSALKRLGVKTQMVIYPRSGHGISEPKFILDIMQRHLDWVEMHLGQDKPNSIAKD